MNFQICTLQNRSGIITMDSCNEWLYKLSIQYNFVGPCI